MRFSIVTGLLAMTAPVFGGYTRCGAGEPGTDLIDEYNLQDASRANYTVEAAASIAVKTHVHVVTTQSTKGRYSQNQINRQIAYMNNAYNPYGIRFQLASTDFTVNNAWANAGPNSQVEFNMKKALRKGNYGELNLYFLSNLDGGGSLLGVCYFPTKVTPSVLIQDGCLILADSLPGGAAVPYNLGGTAAHETGHWFGLLHPFQGDSCDGRGDLIADTPQQKTATSGCPAKKDSCPGKPGLDNIHNYMDYSDDACYNKFTPDQRTRAHNMYNKFRR